jgi:type III pantothenate kinase
MNLVIDIGNTRAKFAVFDKETLIDKIICEDNFENNFIQFVEGKSIKKCISIASGHMSDSLLSNINERYRHIILDKNTPLPITNAYATPDTLGKDRLAAVVGANALYPHEHIIVIDCGTCTTYNFLEDNVFIGGNITPGLQMRNEAMHHFTHKLPSVPIVFDIKSIGDDTFSALQAGAYLGAIVEMQGWIQYFRKKNKLFKIILTGGNATYFFNNIRIKNIVIEEDIVLKGLNHILNFNFV